MKVLYFQHAVAVGGSLQSLLYTIKGLRQHGVETVVVFANDCQDLIDYYRTEGVEAFFYPGLAQLHHSTVSPKPWWSPFTWLHLIQVLRGWKHSKQATRELIEQVKPDLVHLNSMPFTSSAVALREMGVPFLFHIREPSYGDGVRQRFISKRLLLADELIFLSEADRKSWRVGERGIVVPNFVDFNLFDRNKAALTLNKKNEAAPRVTQFLYLGGRIRIKGIFVLLKAARILKEAGLPFKVVCPGGEAGVPKRRIAVLARQILPILGMKTNSQKVDHYMHHYQLEDVFEFLPHVSSPVPFLIETNATLFPSTVPHFPRPIIESAAMGKPAIGSRFPVIEETLVEGETGLLAEACDPVSLASAMEQIILNPQDARQMGEAGHAYAFCKFNMEVQCKLITSIYCRICKL